MFDVRMGNVDDPKDAELTTTPRPCFADKTVRPLLIGQGANDPRVNQAESNRSCPRSRKQRKVTYVIYSDEGHASRGPRTASTSTRGQKRFFRAARRARRAADGR
jgi:dipeptidyl aminopeptidase/acylaminoacyl peptidase